MDKSAENKHSLYVGKGVSIDGKIQTDGITEVHGQIVGEVNAGEIRIQEGGRIEGAIQAAKVDISGFVGNSVTATERLTVRSTGRIEGDVIYGSIQIDPGAVIFGSVHQQKHDKTVPAAKSDLKQEIKASAVYQELDTDQGT